MILERLSITKKYSYKKTEPLTYEGAIKYANERGEISITLNDETSRKVLAVIADQLVETSKQVAKNLTADVITANPAITHESKQ
jgi:hypothetical protein